MIRFACASKEFIAGLKKPLAQSVNVKYGFIIKCGRCFYLTYSKEDSKKLFKYMYEKINSGLYLERKYNKFRKAFKAMGAVV